MNELLSASGDRDAPVAALPADVVASDSLPLSAVSPDDCLPGIRLCRLEVFNWGTFDGAIHTLELNGQTTLLVGQNGAGKSTLVDALLTLLVRPGKTRNYNLAAGANKTERTEKSYILGAFERRSQEDTNRGQVRYLRSNGAGTSTYSILLACFHNATTGRVLTLVQILYLTDNGVEKVYCFADEERSIARHCSGLKGMDKLVQEMKRREFRVTTKYTEYFEWFRKATGMKEQAMDMFNQTVAVKDIHRLNEFIRKHMLEGAPWSDKVDELFKHFKDLSDSHRELENVRRQRDLLEPIERHGAAFREQAASLKRAERLLIATYSYFPQGIVNLFEPEIGRREIELQELRAEQNRLQGEISTAQDECRRLTNELEQAGGDRMREIPLLIRNHVTEAASKRGAFQRLSGFLTEGGVPDSITDEVTFEAVRQKLHPLRQDLEANVANCESKRTELIESRVEPVRALRHTREELQLLMQRQGNVPMEHIEIRRHLCEELGLAERDLPFVAELIAVKSDQHEWESSIEMVLRGLALSLLVPQRHYQIVSRYIDRTPLRDARGRGQKLTYHQIAERERQPNGPKPDARSLYWKLGFREGWSPLLPWVKAELQERFSIRCCDTIEEFHQASDRAMTRQRHIKFGSSRHEKDDRDRVADPRYYVLGWDNREKKRRLAESVEKLSQEVAAIDAAVTELQTTADQLRRQVRSIEEAQRFKAFADVDFESHEREIVGLRMELKAIEENNDAVRILKQRLAVSEERSKVLEQLMLQAIRREQAVETEIANGTQILMRFRDTIAANVADGSFSLHSESFVELDAMLAADPLSLDNFSQKPDSIRRTLQTEERRLREELKPLEDTVVKAMSRFLNANADERFDLDVSVQFLPDFLQLLERIRAEDLPKYEDQFKQRLNEKVGQEIGILRGNLNTERTEIEDRIDLLNVSLRQVPFGNGSHMRLVAKPVRDSEIAAFRQELDACVSGQFEGTLEADEARFNQIASLIKKLREEERWRLKVTDVRNWFDFAAVETDDATGEERSYHDDSAGQSGGEKAKLAFTILIAAIAFQYDLDPHGGRSDRFQFVVVDEMFSRVDDGNSEYALNLFRRFGLQLLIVAPLDAKARVTEDFVGCYLHVSKDERTNRSQVLRMTAREFSEQLSDAAPMPRKSR